MKKMEYIKDFEDFSINEKNIFSSWKTIFNKLKKDLNLNFFFIATFSTTIDAFYPVMIELFENHKLNLNLNKTQICLLTITAITILLNENKDSIKKLKEKLKKENIFYLLKDAIGAIKSIKTLIGNIFVKLGYILHSPGSLIDLFGFTALLVPSMVILKKILSNEVSSITMDDFIGLGLNYGLAISSFLTKQLVVKLTKWIKNIIGNKEKTNEFENIIKENKNKPMGYFSSPFYDPKKELGYIDYTILEIIYENDFNATQIIKSKKFKINIVINSLSKLNEHELIYKNPNNIIRLYPSGKRIIEDYLKEIEKSKNIT